jgi:hypothetical protein
MDGAVTLIVPAESDLVRILEFGILKIPFHPRQFL